MEYSEAERHVVLAGRSIEKKFDEIDRLYKESVISRACYVRLCYRFTTAEAFPLGY